MAKATNKNANAKTETTAAEPGTQDASAEKEKTPRRTPHPFIGSEDPKKYPLTEVPKDFDPSVHSGLRKKDFADEAIYCDYKAEEADKRAAYWRKEAEETRAVGGAKAKKAKKQFVKMSQRIQELRQKIQAQGMDPDEILAAASAEAESEE